MFFLNGSITLTQFKKSQSKNRIRFTLMTSVAMGGLATFALPLSDANACPTINTPITTQTVVNTGNSPCNITAGGSVAISAAAPMSAFINQAGQTGLSLTIDGNGAPTAPVEISVTSTGSGATYYGVRFQNGTLPNGAQATVVNNGRIEMIEGGAAARLRAIDVGRGSTVVNNGEIFLETTNFSFGIAVEDFIAVPLNTSLSANSTVTNNGRIEINKIGTNFTAAGILTGHGNTITNNDDIVINGIAGDSGITQRLLNTNFSASPIFTTGYQPNQVFNNGNILVTNTGGGGAGIRLSEDGFVENTGTIISSANGTAAYGVHLQNPNNAVYDALNAYTIGNIFNPSGLANPASLGTQRGVRNRAGGTIETNSQNGKAIFAHENAFIWNEAGGTLETTGQGAYVVHAGAGSFILNEGLIVSQGIQSTGIRLQTGTPSANTAHNSAAFNNGDIIINNFGSNAVGMFGFGNAINLENMTDGVIRLTNANGNGVQGAGIALSNYDPNLAATLGPSYATNDGLISLERSGVLAATGSNDVFGILGDLDSLIENTGIITGNNNAFTTGIAVQFDNASGNAEVSNSGQIFAEKGINLVGDRFGSSVVNTGTILSTLGGQSAGNPNGIAVRFGSTNNDDTLNIGIDTPSLIVGALDMNGGDDTIVLDRSNNDAFAWRWTFDDFDPSATITTALGACASVTGDCVELNLNPTDVYFISPETDFQRTNDAPNEGVTILVMETGQVQSLSDVSLDIVASAHAAIDSRIEQAWKIHLRKEREIQPDEVVPFEDPDRNWDFWLRPWIGMRHRAENSYLPETLHQWAGFLGGVNFRIDDEWHIGVLGGLAQSNVDDISTGSSGQVDHRMWGAQAHYDNDKVFVDYSILFGNSESDGVTDIKNNLVVGGIEGMGDSPLLKGPFESHSLRAGRRFQLHNDRWDLFLRPSAHAIYVRQTIEDIVYSGVSNSSVSIDAFTTESIQARFEMASELIKTNKRGIFHSDLRMGLAMRGVIKGGGTVVRTTTDQIAIGVEKEGDYTYSLYTGLGVGWEATKNWTLNLDSEVDYSLDKDFTGRLRAAANFRF